MSQAGKRAGLRHGTRSGLWHHIATAIGVLRPSLVVLENTRGLLTARGDEPTAEHLAAEASRDAYGRLLEWLQTERDIARAKGRIGRVRECSARIARVMGLRKRAVARCQWHERRLARAIGTVLGSLAALGFDAEWCCVTAAEAGAPHRRERVFIVAWPADSASGGRQRERPRRSGQGRVTGAGGRAAADPGRDPWPQGHADVAAPARGGGSAAQDPDRAAGFQRRIPAPGQAESGRSRADAGGPGGAPAAHAQGDGRDEGRPEPAGVVGRPDAAVSGDAPAVDAERVTGELADGYDTERGRARDAEQAGMGGVSAAADTEGDGPAGDVAFAVDAGGETRDGPGAGDRGAPADAAGGGCHGRPPHPLGEAESGVAAAGSGGSADSGIGWGPYEPAIRRWESVLGRPAPRPTEPGRTGERLSPRFVEWMQGIPEGWVTDVPGLSRNEQLEALGNGVVPAQAALALSLLLPAWLEAVAA